MHEIKPLEWRTVAGQSDGRIEAKTVGGLLRCSPWQSRSGETGVDWHHIGEGLDGRRWTIKSDGAATMEQARAKCEQIHRDLVSAWLVPAGQVMDEPDEPGVYWIESLDRPCYVCRYEADGVIWWEYWSAGVRSYYPLSGRVAKVGPNPFAKGGA